MQFYATTGNEPDAEVSPKFTTPADLGVWLADGADIEFNFNYALCTAEILADWMFAQCEEWVLHICN